MDIIAENKTTVTKSLFFEAMAAADNFRASALRGLGVLLLAWGALLGVTVFAGMNMRITMMELAMIGAAGIWLVVILPISQYTRAYNAMEKKCGGKLEHTIFFFEAHCEVHSAAGMTAIGYDEIEQVTQSKHALVLTAEDKPNVMAALDGFTFGDAQTVKEMIQLVQEAMKQH